MKQLLTLKAKRKGKSEFKPKEWLRKQPSEKQSMCYFYVKNKYKEQAMEEIKPIIQKYKDYEKKFNKKDLDNC